MCEREGKIERERERGRERLCERTIVCLRGKNREKLCEREKQTYNWL